MNSTTPLSRAYKMLQTVFFAYSGGIEEETQKTIPTCASLQRRVTAVKNSGPAPISAAYPVRGTSRTGFLPGKEVEANFASLLGVQLVSPGRKASLEPPFSQRERKEEEDTWTRGNNDLREKPTYRCAESRAMQHQKGRGYRRGEKAKGGISARTYPEYQIEEEHHVFQTAEAAPGHVALLKF